MALFHCPVCGLPLTDAEARSSHCVVCGGALRAPAANVAQPGEPSTAAPRIAPRRHVARWIGGVVTATALVITALLLWQWQAAQPDRAVEQAGAQPAATAAKTEPKAERVATVAAPKPEFDRERASVAYPPQAASAKAPGEAIIDGDVGARAKPAPDRVEPPAVKVADAKPVPPPVDRPPPVPEPPAFPNNPFPPAMLGGRGLMDKDIDQLLKMAFQQHQELEKLFNMAGMQDLDLLGAGKALQGFGRLQGFPPPRPLLMPFDGPGIAGPAGDVREMTLTGNGITDRDLQPLRNRKTLRGLNLAGTAVTDAGLGHLKALKGLRTLNLRGTRITDKGLESLYGLTDLRELDLSNTRITDEGSKRLQQALPNVEITR